jgi:hypothetical protein
VYQLTLSASPGDSGLLTGNQLNLVVRVPVSLTCNAAAIAGTAAAECPDGRGRGNPGYGTPTVTAFPVPPGTGNSGGRGNPGYGTPTVPPSGPPTVPPSGPPTTPPSVPPTTPPIVPSTPPTPSPSTGPSCCQLSPEGPEDEDTLPATGLPLLALAAVGGLLAGGGAALRYGVRRRRRI